MELTAAVARLSALAHPSRLAAFRLILKAGPDGVPAGRIGEALSVPAPTLSFHLKDLVHAGLVTARREGRTIRYALACDAVRDLLGYLVEDCCGGLDAPPKKRARTRARRPS